jgi:WD40 repeat protein
MQRRVLAGATLGLLLVAQGGMLWGHADKKTDAARIAALIEQLGADSFEKREAASRALAAIGKPAVRALLKAAASSPDLEVRRRATHVLQALAARLPGLVQKAEEVRRIGWPGVHAFHTAFSPDGRLYLAGGDGGTLRLYEVKTGKQVKELAGHTHWMQDAVFTPDGKQVLSTSADRTVRFWDLASGKEVRKLPWPKEGYHSVDLTPDGKWAVSGGADGALRLWEVATGKGVRKFEGHTALCTGTFSPDGKKVLTSSHDKTMRLWDVASGKELRRFEGHTSFLFGAFFLPGGKQALSYGGDQTARVWDLASGKEVRRLALGPRLSDIRGLALAPDGKHVLVGTDGAPMVRLLELATGKEVHRFPLATNPRGLSFSRDGRLAAGGSHRGVVYLWRMPGIFDFD